MFKGFKGLGFSVASSLFVRGAALSTGLIALGWGGGALAGPTQVAPAAAEATVTGPVPVTMLFPFTRTGDTNFPLWFHYQTKDGTAVAGWEYDAASGLLELPAGAATASLPVKILGKSTNPPDRQFSLVLSDIVGTGPTPSFATRQTFGAGAEPHWVVSADVNGDGRPDLLIANEAGDTVSVLLNATAPGAATPAFAAQTTFHVGSIPASVTAADVNGDGRPDLLVANYDSDTVSVLLNTTAPGAATPAFAAQTTFPVGSIPYSVAAADVNGDGRPDLLVANEAGDTVSVLLNATAPGAATPAFAAQTTFPAGSYPTSVAAADVNGDGRPDLLVANNAGSGTVSVLLNTTAPGATTPAFAVQTTFPAGSSPTSVAAADVNGDGRPDLLVANYGSDTVSVLLNTTAPGATTPAFAAQTTFPAGSYPASVTAADVNGDGHPDLLVANTGGDTLSVLLNATAPGATTPAFAAQTTFAAGSAPYSVAAADVNGDGRPDLLVANTGGDTVSVLLNTTPAPTAAAPSFGPHADFGAGSVPTSVTAADVNGDGRPDLLVANNVSDNVSVLLNTTAPGAATPAFAAQTTSAVGSFPQSVAAADVNGDGRPDLLVANTGGDTVSVLLNATAPGAATPAFAAQTTFAVGSDPYSVAAADVNGDGRPDLLVVNYGSDTVSVLLNATAPGAATPAFAAQTTFAVGLYPVSVAAADVNGDGRPDLLVANDAVGGTVSVLLNSTAPGATTPAFAAQTTFAVGSGPYSVVAADVNGDGRPDLLVANYDNTVSVLLNATAPGAATPAFAAQTTFAAGSYPASVAAADVNGDGRPDLLVANYGSDTVSVLLNATASGAATPTFAAQTTFAVGSYPYSVAAADVNGDGRPDLLVVNNHSDTVSVLLNTRLAATLAPARATGTIHYDVHIPRVTLAPTPLSFGNQVVATTGAARTEILVNTGNADLEGIAVSIGGADAADFTQTNDCPMTLVPSASTSSTPSSCTIEVSFTPGAAGARTATLRIESNASTSPDGVDLSGTGIAQAPAIAPTPAALDFGDQAVNTLSAEETLTVKNSGNLELLVTGANIAGADAGDFALAYDGCTAELAPNETCTLKFDFFPAAGGARSATATIGTDQPGVSATVALSGTGLAPAVTLDPTSLAFGGQKVGTTSTTQTVTLTNTGNDALTGISLSISDDYTIESTTCGSTLAADADCTINVSFTPAATGARNGTLAVCSNADSCPDTVTLAGTGTAPAVALTPTSLDFGNQTMGDTGSAETLTVKNTGTAVLDFNGAASIGGTNAGDFAIVADSCGATLAVNASCTIGVTFTPGGVGARAASLAIPSDAPAPSPQAAALSGTGVDNPPVADDQNVATTTNVVQTITLTATDPDSGQTLTYHIVSNPVHGTLSAINGGEVTYTPAANFAGTDSFTFKANDGHLDSNTATITITVADNPPTASDGTNSTTVNVAVNGQLVAAANNPGQALTYSVMSRPSHGAVTVNAATGAYSYTPSPNFAGTDSFTFKANDGNEDSTAATVTITVTDNPPTASDGTSATTTNVAVSGQLEATANNPGQTLTYAIASQPANGTVTVNAATGAYSYTPSANFAGGDSFSFKVNDGNEDSNAATITIAVTDNPPTASDGTNSTTANVAVNGQLVAQANNPDQTLSYAIVSGTNHGVVTVIGATGAYIYQPAPGFAGTDSFTFKASDGNAYSHPATITITVADVPPIAHDGSAATTTNVAVNGQLQATNPDGAGQTLAFQVVAAPASGSVTVNAGTGAFTYTPHSNFAGTDKFTFRVFDGYLYSNTATVTITVTDNPPVATNGTVVTTVNQSVAGQVAAKAKNPGQSLTYAVVAAPASGTVSINAKSGAFTYTPSHNFVGTDSFTFKANDGLHDSNIATETVTVKNTPPIAENGNAETNANTPVTGQLKATDANPGQPLSYRVVGEPTHGQLNVRAASGHYTYIPNDHYAGTDRFSFQVNDGVDNSNVATVTITVKGEGVTPGGSSGGGGFALLGLFALLALLVPALPPRRKRRPDAFKKAPPSPWVESQGAAK